MGHQIIRQPNGRYAVWSTVADDFVLLNAAPEDIVEMELEDHRKRIEGDVAKKVLALGRGERPYLQFTMTWDEALKWRDEAHGKASRRFSERDFMPPKKARAKREAR